MVKKRSSKQRYSELSAAKLEVELNEWILSKPVDYGIDFEVRICEAFDDDMQRVTESTFGIQLKETVEDRSRPYWDLETDDLLFFIGQSVPVLLVLYIKPKDCFYWVISQSYVWDELSKTDPNWRLKKQKRIFFPEKLDSLEKLRGELQDVQNKIYRKKVNSLDIGEGIEFGEAKQHYERSLKEAKNAAFQVAIGDILIGNHESAMSTFEEILQMPKDDEYKFNAIINAVFQLNSRNPQNFDRILKLVEKGIPLGEKFRALQYVSLLKITKIQVFINILYIRISRILLQKKILSIQGENSNNAIIALFCDEDLKDLMPVRQKLVDEFNENLQFLARGRFVDVFDIALTILLEIVSFQISITAPLNLDILKDEEYRKPLISSCEVRLTQIQQPHLKQMFHHRLGEYYYYTQNYELAVSHIKLAIEYAKDINYLPAVKDYETFLKTIKERPDPYKAGQESVNLEEITVKEAQQWYTKQVSFLGYDLSIDDDDIRAIKTGLDDADPSETLKKCEHLRVGYYGTSMMGRALGLPTLGTKLLWCTEKKRGLIGVVLKGCYNAFEQEICKDCDCCCPRDEDWICKMKWIEEEMKNPDMRKAFGITSN